MKATFAIALCLCLFGCAASQPHSTTDTGIHEQIDRASARIGPDWPAMPADIATTDGEIYLGNLNSQIETIETHQRLQVDTSFQVSLASLYYQRFQIEGRLVDAERARDILDAEQLAAGFRPEHRLVHAQVLLGFHDFEAAAQQIDAAAERGAPEADVAALRASLDRALRLPAVNAIGSDASPGNYLDAVRAAAASVDRGRLDEAGALLMQAQALYLDTNPFPLAWIHVQQGIAYLRHGAYPQAQRFFAAAHQRFPQYFLATEHLAETEGLLGNYARSAELYRMVTAQNDHPAFWHGLARAEAALGNTEAARAAAARAHAGYAELLVRYPLMYADHAVGYYLDIGDRAEALRLARLNFEHRQDLYAHLALADALLANGKPEAACEHVRRIRAAGLSPPEIHLPGEALSACR